MTYSSPLRPRRARRLAASVHVLAHSKSRSEIQLSNSRLGCRGMVLGHNSFCTKATVQGRVQTCRGGSCCCHSVYIAHEYYPEVMDIISKQSRQSSYPKLDVVIVATRYLTAAADKILSFKRGVVRPSRRKCGTSHDRNRFELALFGVYNLGQWLWVIALSAGCTFPQ